jgi:hypothetical protein
MRPMLLAWSIEEVGLQGSAAANEPWLAFPPRQEVTITRLGEYTKVVLTKPEAALPPLPQPAWA